MSDVKTNAAHDEIEVNAGSGMAVLVANTAAILVSVLAFTYGIIILAEEISAPVGLGVFLLIVGTIYGFAIGPFMYVGLKILKPNEALVLTLFGRYTGTLRGEGFFFVNPFSVSVNPAVVPASTTGAEQAPVITGAQMRIGSDTFGRKKISLKVLTLSNDKQKINDQLGNPIIIGIVVIWRVVNTAKACFAVDNYKEYLSIQCDSALRNIVRLYPYDAYGDDNEKSLRGSSQEVAEKLKDEIQSKVLLAGLEIIEARITHLSYAQEIAAVMLQRQQASAIIDARQMIVEGAVGMVEMALAKLSENDIVSLDEERKAAMVSNLLVVLCGNRDAQPVVNSGSLY